MSDRADRHGQILAAALGVFGRYGYRRTSMELIAEAAGLSRPALYQYFAGKEEIFRAMGEQAVARLIAQAEAAGRCEGTLGDRLYGALAVKLDFVAGSVEATFRSQLLAEATAVAPELTRSLKEQHVAVLEAVLMSARQELGLLDVALSAHDTAVLLQAALTGIAQQQEELTVLRTRLRQLVDLTTRSLT
jgi:AcrR family transcriptional regulator